MKGWLIFILCLMTVADFSAQSSRNDIDSSEEMRENENRLDSIWRKEDIWNKGVAFVTGKPVKEIDSIIPPEWAVWGGNLEKYFVSQMCYPSRLLEKNEAGYSVVMFSLDTLGLPQKVNILSTVHKEFDKEVIRLVKELPHCLPCRDKKDKRMECFYTVYVSFLPQHYRDRVKTDSIAEEELEQAFVEWEEPARFQDGNPNAVQNYIYSKLKYDSDQLGGLSLARGIYRIDIDSYGEIRKVGTVKSCGLPEWDRQVEEIIKGMPRWTPAVSYSGKGSYQNSIWTVPVVFRGDCQ